MPPRAATLAACAAILATLSAGVQASEKTLQAPQWRARGVAAGKSTRRITTSVAPAPATGPANRAVLQWTGRGTAGVHSRIKQRDAILRVSGYQDADASPSSDDDSGSPFPADFGDSEPMADDGGVYYTASQPADKDAEPPAAQELPMPEATQPDGEPTPLTPAEDLYKEPVPTPPDHEMPLMPDDLSLGIATPPGGVGCKGYDQDCRRALEELQRRDITKIVVGVVIEGTEGEDFPCDCKVGRDLDVEKFTGRNFAPTLFTWKASGQCHKPLYFEDVQLERYGHSWNPFIQPFLSGAHFFVSVPLLPYKMGLKTPNECVYTLGYYRPGSCAPYMIEPIPLSLRAAVYEAWGVTAFTFWFWPPN